MKGIRAGICGLLAFAVLDFGAVQPSGVAVVEIAAGVLLVLWGISAVQRGDADLHWNWLYLPLVAFGLVAISQELFGLTIYAYATKIEVLKWAASALIFFLSVQSFRTTQQVRGFIWFLLSLSFAVSLFGIVQHFTFNGKLYWSLASPPGAAPFGPYVDRDHFAGFVELTAPLGISWLLFRACRREKILLLVLFTLLPIAALVLCASRGGIIGMTFELLLLLFLSRAQRVGRKQFVAGTALALVASVFVVWLGVSQAVARFEQLTPGEISRDRRVSMYRGTWQVFVHHPWAGTGLGTLVVAYPKFESVYDGLVVDHAHNDYLELLADMGVAGGLCGVAFVALLVWRWLLNLRWAESRAARSAYCGAFAACAGMLLHSFVDFNLHILSNALLFLLLASLATSPVEEDTQRTLRQMDTRASLSQFSA